MKYIEKKCIKVAGKAMQQSGMVYEGAKVGVAVSGGVDSFSLLKILKERQKIVPFHFDFMALHVNAGFDATNHQPLVDWLKKEGIAGHCEVTDHGLVAHSDENKSNSPCFYCAMLRRKRLFELCGEYNLTHLAFGHNADDLITNFFMNIFQNGRVDGMSMNEPFFKGKLHVIRPLILLDKKDIVKAAKIWELPIWKNPCPSSGSTKRTKYMEHFEHICENNSTRRRTAYNALTRWQLEKNISQEYLSSRKKDEDD